MEGCETSWTSKQLYEKVRDVFDLSDATQLKILLKGKRLDENDLAIPVFKEIPKKAPKLIIMATSKVVLRELAAKRSDPTIRGFDQERKQPKQTSQQHWGENMSAQSKEYKFCRFQACTWQSFGHRPQESTPHAFQAMQLLEKLATDPGIVAIMKERELVVGTLGEMDPIDDRLMQKKQSQSPGSCLLGYNTNGGTRIDIKLRTDDLQGFRPYPELVSTLVHELSHNWVGEHNFLFWTNYAQMRAEYLYEHARLRSTIVNGRITADIAGLDKTRLENVYDFIMFELQKEMAQHGLNPTMIAAPIRQRCEELQKLNSDANGRRLGGNSGSINDASSSMDVDNSNGGMTAREKALAAAERRARDNNNKSKEKEGQ